MGRRLSAYQQRLSSQRCANFVCLTPRARARQVDLGTCTVQPKQAGGTEGYAQIRRKCLTLPLLLVPCVTWHCVSIEESKPRSKASRRICSGAKVLGKMPVGTSSSLPYVRASSVESDCTIVPCSKAWCTTKRNELRWGVVSAQVSAAMCNRQASTSLPIVPTDEAESCIKYQHG